MSGTVQDVGAAHHAKKRLNVHCDLRDTESKNAEATASKRLYRQPRSHMERSEGH